MKANEVLKNPRVISKEQFLLAYWDHHSNRPQDEPGDEFSLKMYNIHKEASSVTYWQGMLKDVTRYLLLPHHFNGTHFIQPYGGPFADVVEAYSRHAIGESCCNDKVLKMKRQHGKTWLESGDINFLFLSDDSYLAHNGGQCSHYHESKSYNTPFLFMGAGLHRLIAYGFLCKEQAKHIPINIYYCQYVL